jgi:superfamily II DNA helicase RecQ
VDWRPVGERRRKAEARIQAVADYARESKCRRAVLVGYFGEQLAGCAGCDRCGRKALPAPLTKDIAKQLARLRFALTRSKAPWGGCPIEPQVLLALARKPPSSVAALADVPGVGPALTQRLGGVILRALGGGEVESSVQQDPLRSALREWRANVAREMATPAYSVLPDSVLHTIAERRPSTVAELARIPGIGPRALAKFADELLDLSAHFCAPVS